VIKFLKAAKSGLMHDDPHMGMLMRDILPVILIILPGGNYADYTYGDETASTTRPDGDFQDERVKLYIYTFDLCEKLIMYCH
jgi:hypothetical protein